MFTFKPASKNGTTSTSSTPSNTSASNPEIKDKPSNGKSSDAASASHTPFSGWLGLGSGHKNGNGHTNGNGHPGKIESVIGPGISFQGNFSGAGGIRVEGTFDGGINVKGPVVVADGAKVTGDIRAYAVTVAGSVQGNITANKVEIRATGRIFGDLVVTAFATEEGAFLRGQVKMEDDLPTQAPAQLEAPASMPLPVSMPVMPSMVEPESAAKVGR